MTTLPPPTHPKYPLQDEESMAIAGFIIDDHRGQWNSITAIREHFSTLRDTRHAGWESAYEADLSAWREYQRRGDS